MREQTEWTELVDLGVNRLTGANHSKITDAYKVMKSLVSDFSVELYGNGHAAEIIADGLIRYKK